MTSALKSPKKPLVRRRWQNAGVTVLTVVICLMLLPVRLPGMNLLGIGPDWMLIWVVAWSVRRSPWEGAIAGLCLGLLQDAMTAPYPTHILGLMAAGVLTARLQKQRYIQEDIISMALIVFGVAVLSETIMALQISVHRLLVEGSVYPPLSEIWPYHQRVALSSAILSSLWAPALYYPLNLWWERHVPEDLTS